MKTIHTRLLAALSAAVALGTAVTLCADSLQPVSVASGSTVPAAGNSFLPKISFSRSNIVFLSHAKNLVTNDDQREWLDVFARIPGSSNTVLVSVNTNGVGGGNGNSLSASFILSTPDQQQIVFASDADDLVTGDAKGARDIFMRDLITQQTLLLSSDVNGNAPVDPMPTSIIPLSGNPIPAFGRVFFESRATNLVNVPVLTNSVNIYSRHPNSNTAVLVSVDTNKNPFTNYCELADVSTKGYAVAFLARSTPWRFTPSELYLRLDEDPQTASTRHVSAGVSAYGSNYRCGSVQIGAQGSYLVFIAAGLPEGTVLFRYTIGTSNLVAVATNVPEDSLVSVSDFGSYVTYSDGTNLWRANLSSHTRQLVSANMFGAPGNGISRHAAATDDGNKILFISNASDLTPNGSTNYEVYTRDMTAGVTRLVTAGVGGSPSMGVNPLTTTIALPSFGEHAVLDTTASDLVMNDTNAASDVLLFPIDGPVPPVTLLASLPGVQIQWSGDPGRTYHIEYKDTLPTGTWSVLSTAISWNGDRATAIDTGAPGGGRFYRVVREP
jgi:hypothetical protein